MHTILLLLLSTLELSQCLASFAMQAMEIDGPPAPASTLRALDDRRILHPPFLPGTHLNSLLAMFSSSMSPITSLSNPDLTTPPENSPKTSAAHTSSVESTSDSGVSDDFLPSAWEVPKFFADLSAFNITHFAAGRHNLNVVAGVTLGVEGTVYADDDSSSWTLWTNASTMLQLFYPKDSINPARSPQGGSEFYASPLDISQSRNVTLEYNVFFPGDFEWVKGGKLPGLYGGRTGCSGGDPALDCFSTRLMWRAGGAGELYLYAPKDQQTPSLCSTPPLSVCDAAYGLSIARGSFKFSRGAWTHVSQTIVLNSPGEQDGVFVLKVNGNVAIDRSDVFYGDRPREPDFIPIPSCDTNPQLDNGCGWLRSLLGGPIKSRLGFRNDDGTPSRGLSTQAPIDSSTGIVTSVSCDMRDINAPTDALAQQGALEDEDDICNDDCPPAAGTQKTGHAVGFQGVFFSTFFGGHHEDFATPKDQFVWFKDFALYINDA